MAIDYILRLDEALEGIMPMCVQAYTIHPSDDAVPKIGRIHHPSMSAYDLAESSIFSTVNRDFEHLLGVRAARTNWEHGRLEDELANFLIEASSNAFNYASIRAPDTITAHYGEQGIVLVVSQRGIGFDAEHVDRNRIKTNKGGGFSFFRQAKNTIFFDDPHDTRVVAIRITSESARSSGI